jgi:uncharacterized membrane protein YidH (DUF202 family)
LWSTYYNRQLYTSWQYKGIQIMANYKKWTQDELDFIRDNQSTMNDDILAAKLCGISGQNITRSMIRRQRRKLNIKKQRGRPRKNTSTTLQT